MRTRKGGGVLGFGTKTRSDNIKDCVTFFHNHDMYLPENAKKWNDFVDANPNLGLENEKLEYDDTGTAGEITQSIMRDYDRHDKQLCGKSSVTDRVRFPGRGFRSGFSNTLSLANGNVVGGKRRKRRSKRSK